MQEYPTKCTCRECSKEFMRIVDETRCAICADPEGFERFCRAIAKELRKRGVEQEREAERRRRLSAYQ